jgi:hypothetical protein
VEGGDRRRPRRRRVLHEYFGKVDPRVAGKPELVARNYHSVDFLANAHMQLAQDRAAAELLEPYRRSPSRRR